MPCRRQNACELGKLMNLERAMLVARGSLGCPVTNGMGCRFVGSVFQLEMMARVSRSLMVRVGIGSWWNSACAFKWVVMLLHMRVFSIGCRSALGAV
jgi:hypothetical protein